MESVGKSSGAGTPVKEPHGSRSKNEEIARRSENSNPNFSPVPKHSSSPVPPKSAKFQKSASKQNLGSKPSVNPHPVANFSPRNKIRERKFVVAKKKGKREDSGLVSKATCKCKEKAGLKKCLCEAYENLRASQEGFFKSHDEVSEPPKTVDQAETTLEQEIEKGLAIQDLSPIKESGVKVRSDNGETGQTDLGPNQIVSSMVKRPREKTDNGNHVKLLVKVFENLSTTQKESFDQKDEAKPEEEDENVKTGPKWAFHEMAAPKVPESLDSSSFCQSNLSLTLENLGLDPRASVSSSWDGGSIGSISSRTSNGGRRSRRNSLESVSTIGGSRWKMKKLKATSQKPFKLRTEQRGRTKEEEFAKKLQEMIEEEERLRIPIAQGLPWTTDEPECLHKPPVKESTRIMDLKLHSDVRAVERAEFDHQVAEKMTYIEQHKLERERQEKLEEEEEIRRLRKELVPKAQPMPYFDRPFCPRRSEKLPTIPREPRFHVPQHKKIKCFMSFSDSGSFTCED